MTVPFPRIDNFPRFSLESDWVRRMRNARGLIAPAGNSYLWRKKRAAFTLPPMALPLLAAITPPEVQVRLIDEAVEDVDLNLEADLVGLSAMTPTSSRAYALADHFRSRGMKVVMGGRSSLLPSRRSSSALRLCSDRRGRESMAAGFKGCCSRRPKKDIPKFYPFSLDASTPRWDLLPARRYFIPQTVQVSRGCPMACSFCSVSSFFGRSYRYRPIPRILEEMKALKRKLSCFCRR